jgi:hypothetical protein
LVAEWHRVCHQLFADPGAARRARRDEPAYMGFVGLGFWAIYGDRAKQVRAPARCQESIAFWI